MPGSGWQAARGLAVLLVHRMSSGSNEVIRCPHCGGEIPVVRHHVRGSQYQEPARRLAEDIMRGDPRVVRLFEELYAELRKVMQALEQ